MATYDYLRKQALSDIWRNPVIDNQFIIEPTKITRSYGRKKNITVMWETLALPDDVSSWHVYSAGPIPSIYLNLFVNCNGWTSLSDVVKNHNVYLNAYVDNGVELPRFDTWFRYTETGTLIFAAKISKKFNFDLDKQDFFIRLYSGAHNKKLNAGVTPIPVKTEGYYVVDAVQVDAITASIASITTSGLINIYHNGICYLDITLIEIKAGDWLEFIYDPSVYKTLEFNIKDLFHYESDLDSDQKYLIHQPGVSNLVDFIDDIDVYIYQREGAEMLRGLYFHQNSLSNVRQLTHRDYGIKARGVPPRALVFNSLKDPAIAAPIDSLVIRLNIRESALTNNKLVFEHTRLFELYKLSEVDIVRALQGIDANVPMWQAPELEKSNYVEGMKCTFNELTKELAENIYGYNAAAKIVGDTPKKLATSDIQDVVLPIRMRHGCTVYEYDSTGVLTGWYQHLGGSSYRTRNITTKYLEALVGLGSDRVDQLHNIKEATLNEVFTYRIYNGSIIGNAVQNVFYDVTNSDKYAIVDNKFTWTSNRVSDYPIVMSDAKFYARDFEVRPKFGELKVTLISQQKRPAGDGYYTMPFPMGQIDVFLNGRSLIKDLDYFLVFPNVYIVNKEYLEDPLLKEQHVHVRFCGFPTKDFEVCDEGDVGYIEHGFLSNNNRYDLRDDKVQRVIIGGKFYDKSDLKFSEEHQGVSVNDASNGLPYMVKDVLVPVKPYTTTDMYELRDKSRVVDKVVSDYLTLKLPQPDRGGLMTIPKRHKLFSPFINKLITDLRSGVLNLPLRISGFEKQEVMTICKSYEYLLGQDPVKSPHLQDLRFVSIHPHGYPQMLTVNANQYRFLFKAVEYYCDGIVELSSFLKTA